MPRISIVTPLPSSRRAASKSLNDYDSFTGLPGHGKTLFTLAEIHREFVEQPKKKGEAVRPIYYLSKEAVDSPGSGIAGLTLEGWTPFTDVYQWWDLPNGSVIVVDECQYCLPRRSPGKEPDWISAFAEHRKKGFDIYLITQDCRNMDYFVRRLAGQHIHYWRPMGAKAATRWEFPKAVDKPDDHFEQKNATSSVWLNIQKRSILLMHRQTSTRSSARFPPNFSCFRLQLS